jgi:hypothetical protein
MVKAMNPFIKHFYSVESYTYLMNFAKDLTIPTRYIHQNFA